jgi:predicted GIY-YIG superfamily endonuclease
MLRSVKDDLGLNVPGVYRIPCECGKVYVGQTGRSIETRCKEHRRLTRLDQPDKSAVADDTINTGHCNDYSNTIVLERTSSYMDRLVK